MFLVLGYLGYKSHEEKVAKEKEAQAIADQEKKVREEVVLKSDNAIAHYATNETVARPLRILLQAVGPQHGTSLGTISLTRTEAEHRLQLIDAYDKLKSDGTPRISSAYENSSEYLKWVNQRPATTEGQSAYLKWLRDEPIFSFTKLNQEDLQIANGLPVTAAKPGDYTMYYVAGGAIALLAGYAIFAA